MEHVGSLESTKEALELPEAIAEGNSSFLRSDCSESPFPLFFSFSASSKNSSPREKVGKLSSF